MDGIYNCGNSATGPATMGFWGLEDHDPLEGVTVPARP